MDLSKHVKFTKQQTFDVIIEGLAKQGWRRATTVFSSGADSCRYLTPEGLRCAAGQLVKPDRYDPLLDRDMGSIPEGNDELVERYASLLLATGLADHDLEFVHEAQVIHDTIKAKGPIDQAEEMRDRYRAMAMKHDLVLPPALTGAAAAA